MRWRAPAGGCRAATGTQRAITAEAVSTAAQGPSSLEVREGDGAAGVGVLAAGGDRRRPGITGGGTFLGGVFHTLPFLISDYHVAIVVAIIIVSVELLVLAWLRWKFFETNFIRSFISVTVGGAIIASLSAGLGVAASG
jgi:VIT1/CCC1 family predicted Fe2+/Mn2+ transporter